MISAVSDNNNIQEHTSKKKYKINFLKNLEEKINLRDSDQGY